MLQNLKIVVNFNKSVTVFSLRDQLLLSWSQTNMKNAELCDEKKVWLVQDHKT